MRALGLLLSLALVLACGSEPSPSRDRETTLALDQSGVSEPLEFTVPEDARSLTVVVTGDPAELYALGSLVLGGEERVGIALDGSHAGVMTEQYEEEQIGQMPGDLYQSIRLGTFTQIYPYRPDQSLPAGPAELRVVSTMAGGEVTVRLLFPPDDGASTLRVNLLAISESVSLGAAPAFFGEAREILAPAGVELELDEIVSEEGTGFSQITDFTEPQESPQTMSTELARLGPELVSSDSLNVFVVDSLPAGVGGLSLGTPGPPDPDSYYWGVVLRHSSDDALLGRVFAHEVAHFMGLQHVENRGLSGTVYPDPLDDTEPGTGNLMDSGTAITPDQSFVLSKSPLLVADPAP